MKCYNRHNNGIYLLTCMEPDGHKGLHKDEGGETWKDEDGWFDQYGEKRRKASECRRPPEPERPPVEVEPEPPPKVEKVAAPKTACYNCRQGAHARCVFPPEFCPCKRANHGATP